LQNEFNSWYSTLELTDNEKIRAARWDQIQAILKSPSWQLLEALTRLAFGTKLTTAQATSVRDRFSKDSHAPGDAELSLLAASALSILLKKRGAAAAKTATFVIAATCAGQRSPQQPMNLIGIAEDALAETAEASRRRPVLELEKPSSATVDASAAIAALQSGELAQLQNALAALASAVSKTMATFISRQRQFEAVVQEHVRIQDEELDVLWWLQGKHSTELNVPFESVPTVQAPLVFAKELADLTTVLPGPTSVSALLSRAGVAQDAQVKISEVVQALPINLLDRLIHEDRADKLSSTSTPILEAVRRRQEVNGQDDWVRAWSTVCGLNPDTQVSSLKLAEAAYRELILVNLG
jgi:hypothetical protein